MPSVVLLHRHKYLEGCLHGMVSIGMHQLAGTHKGVTLSNHWVAFKRWSMRESMIKLQGKGLLHNNMVLGIALMNMYSKCGAISKAP